MIGAANGAAWLVFGGVLLTAIVAGAFVESGGHNTRIRRRSERLAKACKGLPAAKMSQALPAGSIRREEAGGAGILDALARRCLPRQSVLRDRLARTGYDIALGTYLMLNLGIGALMFVFAWLAGGMPPLLSACASLVFGLGVPHLAVGFLGMRRRRRFIGNLPDALDLLVICAGAGLSLDAALTRVAREMAPAAPEVADEIGLTALELGFLPDRKEALRNLTRRCQIEPMRGVVNTLTQTERYGTPLAHSLRVLASEYRGERMLKAEAKAAKLPAVLTVPMIIFILPPLMIVLIGPGILRTIDALSKL